MESQLSEIWDERDDWRGISSAQERRRRQNRLHQRAHRKALQRCLPLHGSENVTEIYTTGKKRALRSLASSPWDFSNSDQPCQNTFAPTAQEALDIAISLGFSGLAVVREHVEAAPIFENALNFLQHAYLNWTLGRPNLSDIPSVTRLNALDGLMRNASILQIPAEFLATDDLDSRFNFHGPMPRDVVLPLPPDLRPTAYQRSIRHHSWLDLFPFPRLRDNILRCIETGVYDEEDLCQELCCDLLNSKAQGVAAVVIWGDSWNTKGREFSANFYIKWSPLLQGCTEILESTNYWRGRRGLAFIELPVSRSIEVYSD